MTTTNTTLMTATTTTATKPRDLESIAASYESVNDEKSNGKSSDTTSGRTVSKSGKSVDVGCDWVVSPGWKLRRRVADESVANELPNADRKSINCDDVASTGGRRENVDDMGCQSPQGTVWTTCQGCHTALSRWESNPRPIDLKVQRLYCYAKVLILKE